MINLEKAYQAFDDFVDQYDLTQPLIRLKVVHTYAVVDVMKDLCHRLRLNEDDTSLALLMALLHDYGRFEQYRIYHTFFDYKSVDHADYSCVLLFDHGEIRNFIEEDTYDELLRAVISQHNKYKVKEGYGECTLFFINLMRDADKLDHWRVKEEEKIETLLHVSEEELSKETISDSVITAYQNHELVYAKSRKTHLDMWLSYIAFIFDYNFKESIDYIKERDSVNKSFDRITPQGETRIQYEKLRQIALDYINSK